MLSRVDTRREEAQASDTGKGYISCCRDEQRTMGRGRRYRCAGQPAPLRILSVVDVFTRECLALETDTSLGSVRVIRVLDQIITNAERRNVFVPTTGRSLPAAASSLGAWTVGSNWSTSGQANRWRTRTWKV